VRRRIEPGLVGAKARPIFIVLDPQPRPERGLQAGLAQVDFDPIAVPEDRPIAGPVGDGSELEKFGAGTLVPGAAPVAGQLVQYRLRLDDEVLHAGPLHVEWRAIKAIDARPHGATEVGGV